MVDDSCKYYINAYIDKGTDKEWQSMDSMGNSTYRRLEAWDKLRNLKLIIILPGCL